MKYYLNELGPSGLQQLVNAILVARYGEQARLTPLHGRDDRMDGLLEPDRRFLSWLGASDKPAKKTLFQVKFHHTEDARLADLRKLVLRQFRAELSEHPRLRTDSFERFILVTNVPASRESLRQELDEIQRAFQVRATIWWKERLTAFLDLLPQLWVSFPMIFPGGQPPVLSQLIANRQTDHVRLLKTVIRVQYERDRAVKFRQIDLERDIESLFVDLELEKSIVASSLVGSAQIQRFEWRLARSRLSRLSAINSLLVDEVVGWKILLEGGPGQGKSTLTQMLAQIYRAEMLDDKHVEPDGRWEAPSKRRIPIRIDLKDFASYLSSGGGKTLEQYIAQLWSDDSGGTNVPVNAVHAILENSPMLLILDGLDEVGGDDLRDGVLDECLATVSRLEGINADLKVILTSRPPAVAGRRSRLESFLSIRLVPMRPGIITEYVNRWTAVQLTAKEERRRVRTSYNRRRNERHVEALSRNPMQLSVLLHFIKLKGEAFPDRRAELYRTYFETVIDRDVEKSAELRSERETVEALHRFLGFMLHARAEEKEREGALSRLELLSLVGDWLCGQGDSSAKAASLFRLGEERLGLIMTLRGEGEGAVYGFEIQPIREYFAAAWVNEDYKGEAHDVFIEMLRRPFWMEVALFLGGLKRPNERADLIMRARSLDSTRDFGWRQQGREAIGQLLVEGALAHPPHVAYEGVRFLLEALDVKKIPVQRESVHFISDLRGLIGTVRRTQHFDYLQDLSEQAALQGDYMACERLVSAMAGTSECRQSIHRIVDSFDDWRFVELTVLAWCLGRERGGRSKLVIPNLVDRFELTWWVEALKRRVSVCPGIVSVQLPERLQWPFFVASTVGSHEPLGPAVVRSLLQSKQSPWMMLGMMEALRTAKFGSKVGQGPVIGLEEFDSSFAPAPYADLSVHLYRIGVAVLNGLRRSETAGFRKSVGKLIALLDDRHSTVGLAGWLVGSVSMRVADLYWDWLNGAFPFGPDSSEAYQTFEDLLAGVAKFRSGKAFEIRRGHPDLRFPEVVRGADESWTNIENGMRMAILRDGETEWDFLTWLDPRVLSLPALLAAFSGDLHPLLRYFAKLNPRSIRGIQNLSAPHMQKLAGELRRGSEKPVALGAIALLANSKFFKIFKRDLMAKLLQVGEGSELISSEWIDGGLLRAGARDEAAATDLAKLILDNPREFPHGIRSSAANYWAGHKRVDQAPLVEALVE